MQSVTYLMNTCDLSLLPNHYMLTVCVHVCLLMCAKVYLHVHACVYEGQRITSIFIFWYHLHFLFFTQGLSLA